MVYETMVINRLAQKRGDFVPAPQIKRFSYSTAPPVHEPAPNIPAPFFRPGSVQILNELIVKGIELGRVRKDDFRNAFTNNLFNPLVGDCNIGVDRREIRYAAPTASSEILPTLAKDPSTFPLHTLSAFLWRMAYSWL